MAWQLWNTVPSLTSTEQWVSAHTSAGTGKAWVSRVPGLGLTPTRRPPRAPHSLLSWLMEQGSISRSSEAGQFPVRQESTKSGAVPSTTPALVMKSSVVSPLKVPQSPAPAGP